MNDDESVGVSYCSEFFRSLLYAVNAKTDFYMYNRSFPGLILLLVKQSYHLSTLFDLS